jgi:pimeloyl-ACP methyl ester carboxylesterase
MDDAGGFVVFAPRAIGRRQLIAGAGVAVMAAGLAACDSGDDERSEVTSGAAPDTSGAPATTGAPSTTGSDATTASAPESSAPAGGGSEEEVKAIALFATPLQNQFAAWAFEYVAEGADVGEIEAIANDVASEDDAAYYDAWYEHATRHRAKAEEAEAQGKMHTALYHHMRAAVYASVSYKLLFGAPVDPRLATAFETQTTSFDRAMGLIDPPAERLNVTLDGNQLVVYFLRAKDAAPGEPRPTIVMVNGYDASVSDMYLAMGLQALPRGYHVVLVDGPGQGALLVQDGVPMIAEWERVIGPVVDALVGRPDVDPARIVLQGWSLGGQLSLRGAAGEPRIAAVVSDPPAWSLYEQLAPAFQAFGLSPEAIAQLPEISDEDLAKMEAGVNSNQRFYWIFVQRGLWVNGATDLRDWLQKIAPFTLEGVSDGIQCPVLGTFADRDALAVGAQSTLDRLNAPTTLLPFSAAEGAGAHQETLNRALAETLILDWLDETLA